MKKLVFAAALLCSLSAFANIRVDEELKKQFHDAFPTASSVQWYDSKDAYEVYFIHNNVQCRISYGTDGKMQQMRRDYKKEVLPMFITASVQQKYPGKKIFGVTEITSPEGITYHIVLEDAKHWVFVESSSGGEMMINKRLRKS